MTDWAWAQTALQLADPTHAARQGPGAGARGLDHRADRRLGLPRGAGGEGVLRRHAQHDLRGRPAGARPAQLLRPDVGAADRHQVERRRAVVPRPVLQDRRRAHRRLRRLRRARHFAGADPVARRRRRDRAARRLHRQVHEHGGPRGLPSALQGAADLQGQDLGLLRRRRHVRPLLPQGYLRGSGDDGGLPGQVRHAAGAAEDLGGIRPDRPVHHRPEGARDLRRRPLPQGGQPREPVRLPAAVPRQRRAAVRREHEGRARLAGRGQDTAEHARRERCIDPGQQRARSGLALGGVPDRQGRDDLLVAALRPNGGELLAERHGDQLRSALGDRRQGRLRGRSGKSRARHRLQQGAVGRLGEPGGRLSVHAVGDLAAGVAGAGHAALRAARPLPAVALHVGSLCPALAGREGIPHQPQQLGQRRAARPDHARRAGLLPKPRPHGDRGLGRRRPAGRRSRPPPRSGTTPPTGSASTRRRRSTPSS